MGANFIMVPMIRNIDEFKSIVDYVGDRADIIPLIETSYSLFNLNLIIEYSCVKQIHFGLNDLCIDIGFENIFQILLSKFFKNFIDHAVEMVDLVGIGGIGSPQNAMKVDSLLLLAQYIDLKSTSVILSRSFFNNGYIEETILKDLNIFEGVFKECQSFLNKELFNEQVKQLNINK
jgi:hypothetical protein